MPSATPAPGGRVPGGGSRGRRRTSNLSRSRSIPIGGIGRQPGREEGEKEGEDGVLPLDRGRATGLRARRGVGAGRAPGRGGEVSPNGSSLLGSGRAPEAGQRKGTPPSKRRPPPAAVRNQFQDELQKLDSVRAQPKGDSGQRRRETQKDQRLEAPLIEDQQARRCPPRPLRPGGGSPGGARAGGAGPRTCLAVAPFRSVGSGDSPAERKGKKKGRTASSLSTEVSLPPTRRD